MKLNTTPLKNQWVKEEITWKIKNYLETWKKKYNGSYGIQQK